MVDRAEGSAGTDPSYGPNLLELPPAGNPCLPGRSARGPARRLAGTTLFGVHRIRGRCVLAVAGGCLLLCGHLVPGGLWSGGAPFGILQRRLSHGASVTLDAVAQSKLAARLAGSV